MRTVCAIEVESGVLRILFTCVHHNRFVPLAESSFDVHSDDLQEVLRSGVDTIEGHIREKEKQYSFSAEKIYCLLPPAAVQTKTVEDVIPLSSGKKKKITPDDIDRARLHIENVALDWHELCLHDLILEYYVDEVFYPSIPPALEGRKVRLKSQLFFIERKLFRDTENFFENIGRKFAGFICAPLADISVNHQGYLRSAPYVTCNIGRERTLCSGLNENRLFFEEFDFSEKKMESALGKRFLLSPEVCAEIFFRYVSLIPAPVHKEVVIKNGSQYVNVSVASLSSFVQEFLAGELERVLIRLEELSGGKRKVLFLGKVPLMKGFWSFLKNYLPTLEIEPLGFRSPAASLLGGTKYGTRRYLERSQLPRQSIWGKIAEIYREYF